MRGFLGNYRPVPILAIVIVFLAVTLPLLVLYQMQSLANSVSELAAIVLEQERRYIIDRAAQVEYNKTMRIRVDSLTDEQRWIREQSPTSRASTRQAYLMEVTAYTCHPEECGKQPWEPGYCTTTAGLKLQPVHNKKIVAADPRVFPAGTRLMIDGVGEVLVSDTGSAIKGNRLDLFWDEHDRAGAYKFGRRYLKVTVLK